MKYFPNEADLNETEQHVTTFRQLLARVSGIRDAFAGRSDHAGAADDALVLLGEWRDLLRTIGLADLGGLVCEAETLDEGKTPEAAALAGVSRLLLAVGPGFMQDILATIIAADLGLMSFGDPPLLAANIPRRGRPARPALLAGLKAQAVRHAHYLAGLSGGNWKTELYRLRIVSDSALKAWNRELSQSEREDCRRVGERVRRGLPLSPADEAIKAQATRYDAAKLQAWLAALLTGEGGQFQPPRN
jgi:hypothetical protein